MIKGKIVIIIVINLIYIAPFIHAAQSAKGNYMHYVLHLKIERIKQANKAMHYELTLKYNYKEKTNMKIEYTESITAQ